MQHGKTILGRRHVLPGVVTSIHDIQVEGTFLDGVFLVTVHDPICTSAGDLSNVLYGSFLPTPSEDLFPLEEPELYSRNNAPGAVIVSKTSIVLNKGRERVKIRVTNNGDRPIQVGSHYHSIETNLQLSFDRSLAYGKRLDIPAGTAVRFEPGDTKTVILWSTGTPPMTPIRYMGTQQSALAYEAFWLAVLVRKTSHIYHLNDS
ncbi:hypothetical protein M422DRAFT_779308 [Sphaerobolus stellatus SS14]|uniref:urease n=1 Tax=Sphaerobolus stellatus (strain SS14) TaxID=990650 RepID=A0A0C9UNH4_SPHS4|nr:hypothetical protein M422DRAFT_779308 [Sphaerobolus stellatus SS14]